VKHAYGIESIDLPSTAAAKSAHDERLRALLGDRTPRPLARVEGGGFVVETNGGHLRRLRWSSFHFPRYNGLSAELADAFNSGAGTDLDRDNIGVIIAELSLLEHPNDYNAFDVVAANMPAGMPTASIHAGIDAMLAKILEIDPDHQAERWTFDVPLREAVRTAAAWAVQESEPVQEVRGPLD
jgi:hypothetical protein